MAIKSFVHKGAEEVFVSGRSRRIGNDVAKRLRDGLDYLDGATSIADVRGLFGFHSLRGDLAGYFAVSVTGNWRLVFRFEHGNKGDILDVDFIDYH
jgi:proteic killer suppression protein